MGSPQKREGQNENCDGEADAQAVGESLTRGDGVAANEAREAEKLDAKDPNIPNVRGAIYLVPALRRFDEAKVEFEKALPLLSNSSTRSETDSGCPVKPGGRRSVNLS